MGKPCWPQSKFSLAGSKALTFHLNSDGKASGEGSKAYLELVWATASLRLTGKGSETIYRWRVTRSQRIIRITLLNLLGQGWKAPIINCLACSPYDLKWHMVWKINALQLAYACGKRRRKKQRGTVPFSHSAQLRQRDIVRTSCMGNCGSQEVMTSSTLSLYSLFALSFFQSWWCSEETEIHPEESDSLYY